MKYIIDIEENPLCVFDKDTHTYFPRLWRVKGFNSLVFDEEGLSRLEELTADYINEHYGQLQDDAYQRGLDDAWEAARKIIRMSDGDILDLFPDCYASVCTAVQAILKYDASEAIAKLKAYEEKQKAEDEIRVGDEVETEDGKRFVVTTFGSGFDGDIAVGVCADGLGLGVDLKELRKTGRHFDISSILKEMQS